MDKQLDSQTSVPSTNALLVATAGANENSHQELLTGDSHSTARKKVVLVVGMHRSGTSAVTRGLKALGVELGDRLWPPNEQVNAKGFWEDMDVNALNIEMMGALDTDWHYLSPISPAQIDVLAEGEFFPRAAALLRAKVSDSKLFGFKDPRVAKLLPFWRIVAEHCEYETSFLIMTRHPLSVVASLHRREHFDAEKSHLLWLVHMLASLSATNGCQRVLVDYDRLMQKPERELARIASAFGLSTDIGEAATYQSEFLDETLRHTTFDLDDLSNDCACPPLVNEVYKALLAIASDETHLDGIEFRAQLDRWQDEFARLGPLLQLADKLWAKAATFSATVGDKERAVSALSDQLAAAKLAAEAQIEASDSLQTLVNVHAHVVSDLKRIVFDRQADIARLGQELDDGRLQIAALGQAAADWESESRIQRNMLEDSILACTRENVQLRQDFIVQQNQLVRIRESFMGRIMAPLLGLDASGAPIGNSSPAHASISIDAPSRGGDESRSGTNGFQIEMGHSVSGKPDQPQHGTNLLPPTQAPNCEALMEHEGQRFVEAAYVTLLNRTADYDGLSYYRRRLQQGESKLQILHEISTSAEGKAARVELVGLTEALRRAKLN